MVCSIGVWQLLFLWFAVLVTSGYPFRDLCDLSDGECTLKEGLVKLHSGCRCPSPSGLQLLMLLDILE